MANHEIRNPKEFLTDLRKIEVTDPAHADVVNPLFDRLVNNDAYLDEKKGDKPATAVTGNLAAFDGNKNVVDTGKKVADFDASGKVDKPAAAIAGHLAVFDAARNVVDGGASPVAGGYVTAGQKAGTTLGSYATAEGADTTASGSVSHAEGSATIASAESSHAEGKTTTASSKYSHAEGWKTVASNDSSHAEGNSTTASGYASHAEGGGAKAIGTNSHAEGGSTTASGGQSHAEGGSTTASGGQSHAEGNSTTASGDASHAGGYETIAGNNQYAIGKFNIESVGGGGTTGDVLIIGKGTNNTTRANAFRVSSAGLVFSCGSYATEGADYAELFEYEDGNPNGEDRRGLFVALKGEKISIASGAAGEYILGAISATPSVLGNTNDDQWRGMYEKDIFGEKILGEVVKPEYTDENGVFRAKERYMTEKVSASYDPETPYIPRTARKEWGKVGMLGRLVVIDDGTCEVDGNCKPSKKGKATKADTGYRVMSRLDDTHITVLIK